MAVAEQIRSVEIPADVREAIVAATRRAGVEEACGLLVGRRVGAEVRVVRAVECENVAPAPDRQRRFEIDPRIVIEEERQARAEKEGVVGFYHSHPASDPVPSEVDRRYMGLWPDSVWLIAGPAGDGEGVALRAWEPGREAGGRPAEIEVKGGAGP